jgi:hypothetical protein
MARSGVTVRIFDDGRLLVANDNNYPPGNGRVRSAPDETEMITLSALPFEVLGGDRAASGTMPPRTGSLRVWSRAW